MQSSSSSPNHNEDFGFSENDEHSYRVYDKLAPKIRNQHNSFSTDDSAGSSFKRPQGSYQRKESKSRASAETGSQRKRGRQSKDEQLAQDHGLPASAEEFALMSHMQIQAYLRDVKLTPLQKSLIKKIRRRGNYFLKIY
jgi:nuclear factor erythroid 2-related factor 2